MLELKSLCKGTSLSNDKMVCPMSVCYSEVPLYNNNNNPEGTHVYTMYCRSNTIQH